MSDKTDTLMTNDGLREAICASQVRYFADKIRYSLHRVHRSFVEDFTDQRESNERTSRALRSDLNGAVDRLRRIGARLFVLSSLPETIDVFSDFGNVVRNYWRSAKSRVDTLVIRINPPQQVADYSINEVARLISEHDLLFEYATVVRNGSPLNAKLQQFEKSFVSHSVELHVIDAWDVDQLDIDELFVDFEGIRVIFSIAMGRTYSRAAIKEYDRRENKPPYDYEHLPQSEKTGRQNGQKLFRLSDILKWTENHPKATETVATLPRKTRFFSAEGQAQNIA